MRRTWMWAAVWGCAAAWAGPYDDAEVRWTFDSLEADRGGITLRSDGNYWFDNGVAACDHTVFVAGPPDAPALNPAGDALTIVLKMEDPSGVWDHTLFAKHGGHENLTYNLFCASLDMAWVIGFELGLEGSAETVQLRAPLSWVDRTAPHTIVARYDGSKADLIVDGRIFDSKPAKGKLRAGNAEPLIIGGESQNGAITRTFRGAIDDAALWHRALSDAEIAEVSDIDALAPATRPTMAESIAWAEKAVTWARETAAADPRRPIYHATSPANWINDPNGPIFVDGVYHLFYQHNPYGPFWGNMHWGHLSSTDLVYWKHEPIALAPSEDYDAEGIFSGCAAIVDGVPTIFYTGVSPEVQCIATSTDGLQTWTKHAANPVIAAPPAEQVTGFRDPYVWKNGGQWQMVLGGGFPGQGGAAFLYASDDFVNWTYAQPLTIGPGQNWECPNFFPLGGRHVLIVSPHGKVRYSAGAYDGQTFSPGPWHPLDHGTHFYAPNGLFDAAGRHILWGWANLEASPEAPWRGVMTLPRVLRLTEDGRVASQPAPELAALRGDPWVIAPATLEPGAADPLTPVAGDAYELELTLHPGSLASVSLDLLLHEGVPGLTVTWDVNNLVLSAPGAAMPCAPAPGRDTLTLRVFVDRSLIEIYGEDGRVMTVAVPLDRPIGSGARLTVPRGAGRLVDAKAWPMATIWE